MNGPGEARETDIGFTGGGNGTHLVYIAGQPDHRLKDADIVDHLVELVEKKAAEIEASERQPSRRNAEPPSARPDRLDPTYRSMSDSYSRSAARTTFCGDEMRRHRHVVEAAREVAERYGYREMATPIFEFSEVFARTLGDTSDIVTKEMYTFTDRGGEKLTLRPEDTAGVARAVISSGLRQNLPLKFFYAGPMFRYERPQKGR